MSYLTSYLLVAFLGYLVGSIPTAYIFGRLIKGLDIRKFGSGNVGATNAWRVLGKKIGLLVLLVDVLKGFVCVWLLPKYIFSFASGNVYYLSIFVASLSVVSGHIWTVFLRFKGGKGVATSLGALLGMAVNTPSLWAVLGWAVLVWLVVFGVSRIVSLASLVTAVFLPLFALLFLGKNNAVSYFLLVISLLVIIRHRANIRRLCTGKESRLF